MSEGTELFLPVEVSGGLFSIGDTHAVQGDGEVCGTAIESQMNVALQFDLVKGAEIPFPHYRTSGPVTRHLDSDGYFVTTGIGPDLFEGARNAVSGMIDLLGREQGLAPADAYMLCSVCGDLRISEIVDMPNWVVSSWPPETQDILRYQWEDQLFPFWTEIAALAKENGVERIALELHGNQCVYNVPSLQKLRSAIGPVIGANLDPSHLFWMGADPLVAAEALGDAIYHVHAKDTLLNTPVQATTSLLENGSLMDIPARSWSYITLGFGHGEEWWRQFCYRLKMAGYDGWLSIEHEDVLLNSLEGLEKSVALLQGVMPGKPADYRPQDI